MIRKNRAIPAHELNLLIFDLDGTLVDSRLDLANSVNAMLRHYGKPELPNDVIGSFIGNGAPMLVRRSLGDPDDEKFVQEALLFFMNYYRAHKLDTTYVYEGVFAALDAILASRNGSGAVKMAVLSNKPVGPTRAIVEALGLGKYFFQIYGGNSFEQKKPHPIGIERLVAESGADRGRTVMVGDSAVDVLTARAASVKACGVAWGFQPETFATAPPDFIVDDLRALAEMVLERA